MRKESPVNMRTNRHRDDNLDSLQDEAMQHASRNGVYFFQLAAFLAVFAIVVGIWQLICENIGLWAVIVATAVALLAVSCMHIAQQWERIVVLRLGKLHAVKGPGLFFTIPLIEYCTMRVDTRVRSTAFGAEETLTNDLVPLDVDAVLFWMVHDAEKACTVVDDYSRLVLRSAQTILRDAIGRANAAEVTSRRNQLDRELKRSLEEKVAPWGITVMSVEIRDILLPKELQDVMSMEAQAGIGEMMSDIAPSYENDDTAMELRKMHLLYEGIRDGKGSIVVPSNWGESLGEQLKHNPEIPS